MRSYWLALGCLLSTQAAQAGDQPLYQPAPGWIVPAPAQQPAGAGGDAPQTEILDTQVRIENGAVWTYEETAQRIISADALNRMGPVALQWAPDHGDLIIHGVTIIRDGQRIDALAGGLTFTVLRREANLERRMLDGLLTATLAVEGLRVGDVLDLRYSVTAKDQALAGNVAAEAFVAARPTRVGFGRARLLWPDSVQAAWKLYPAGATPTVTDAHGWHELSIGFPLPQQPDPAPQAPGRFAKPSIIELSSFAGWPSVSSVMAPLYATNGLITPGSPLAQEVARIAATTADPRQRSLLALQLVQDKVRYFAASMNGGNYIPAPPERTWTTRYGDCKAKTLLLLAILHGLQIDAEPALANLQNGDLVHDRLPSVAAFDHILVLAHVGGQTLWLEGTGLGARADSLDDVPPYHWVLPVRAAGAELMPVPNRVPAKPQFEIRLVADMRGGINLAAPVEGHLLVRGAQAGQWRTTLAGLDEAGRDKFLTGIVGRIFEIQLGSKPRFAFDEATGSAAVSMDGIGHFAWTRADERYVYDAFGAPVFTPPDRSRSIWKDIPVDAGRPTNVLIENTILLPGDGHGLSLYGSPSLDVQLPGNRHVSYQADLSGAEMKMRVHIEAAGGEISPDALPELRAKNADIKSHALRLRTDTDYPAPWHFIEAGKRAQRYDAALRISTRRLPTSPTMPSAMSPAQRSWPRSSSATAPSPTSAAHSRYRPMPGPTSTAPGCSAPSARRTRRWRTSRPRMTSIPATSARSGAWPRSRASMARRRRRSPCWTRRSIPGAATRRRSSPPRPMCRPMPAICRTRCRRWIRRSR